MNRSLLLLLTLPLLAACSEPAVRQDGQQVTISLRQTSPDAPRRVRLEVVGDKIIRVSATPEARFADPQSLVVLPATDDVDYTLTELADTAVVVATRSVRATVSRRTGRVVFSDATGRVWLAETAEASKTFTPCEAHQDATGTAAIGDFRGYSFRLQFDSPRDEAFYGLGQHQAGEWNYKGRDEELYQYNTKISVPFVVSSRGYGLYVDSYSLCRWGTPSAYAALGDVFGLSDREGREGALTGTYTVGGDTVVVRREDSLCFEDLRTTPLLPRDVRLSRAEVTYEGTLEPKASGDYRFRLYYAGYVKVYVGDSLVQPEIWRTAWNPNSAKFRVRLEARQRVPLRIEWRPDGDESYCGLRALPPVSAAEAERQSWWSELTPQMDYYFIAGTDMDDVIHGLRTLTGHAPLMPRWAMGFWQSRERYKTQAELLDAVRGFRDRHLPLDNIVLDWSYWPKDAWGSHEFDADRFPDPRAMVDSVHARHATLMISVWPKFYTSTRHYQQLADSGWIYRQSVRDSLVDWIWPGYHYAFYDAYAAGARRLFWQQMHDRLYGLGVDAWWMDASEPNVRDCTPLDYRKALCGPTALGPSDRFFNTYALMNAQAIWEGQRAADPDRRVFLLTRSGFAGLQRYSTAAWSGDIGTRWEDLRAQIPAGLNFSMSGIPWWTMDIGGFSVERRYELAQKAYDKTGRESDDLDEWRELQARWYQFGAFVPLYRAHGQWPRREVWNIAPPQHPAYRSIVWYTRLRYRLLPYVYSLAAAVSHADYTLMRPLAMDFTADTAALTIGDQYLFGPALMVAPVGHYKARSRSVYLPANPAGASAPQASADAGWYDFYTGRHLSGGQTLDAPAPYERIPLYVRAGSIIPYGPDLEWTSQRVADTLRLYVYTGRSARFDLYDDQGLNNDYERGLSATIPIRWDEPTHTLTLDTRRGAYPEMPERRTFIVVPVTPTRPHAFDPDASGIAVAYDGNALQIPIDP